jgi:hypothetical protein
MIWPRARKSWSSPKTLLISFHQNLIHSGRVSPQRHGLDGATCADSMDHLGSQVGMGTRGYNLFADCYYFRNYQLVGQ